jgi:hypothetical protein
MIFKVNALCFYVKVMTAWCKVSKEMQKYKYFWLNKALGGSVFSKGESI